MPQHPIFFLHNPKAGGSSLRSLMGELFAPNAIAPVFSHGPNDHRKSAATFGQHRGYAFYAGHYGHDAYARLSDGHLLVTNFRDPVERIVSIYRYWRNNISPANLVKADPRDAAIVMLAHQLSFHEFIRHDDPDLQLYIRNFHFRQLLGSPWEVRTIRPWDRWKVKRRISHMPWFYVAEMPNISTLLLQAAIPELADTKIPIENSSQGERIRVSKDDIEHLVRVNRLDYEIYYHAVRVQRARLRSLSQG